MDFLKLNPAASADIMGAGAFQEALLNYFQGIVDGEISQDKTISDFSFFHAARLTNVDRFDFFTGDIGAAYSNLRQFIRPESEHAIITMIRIFEGTGAIGLPAEELLYTPGIADADLMNGTIEFTVNGVRQSVRIPLFDFVQAPEEPFSGVVKLGVPIPWTGQTELTARLVLENASATDSIGLSVEVGGYALI